MMNGLRCLLYPCDGAEHAVFILADPRVGLKWFGATLGQLDSFGNAEVVIHLLTRAAVKFTKERLILDAESHKLDSEIEPRREGPKPLVFGVMKHLYRREKHSRRTRVCAKSRVGERIHGSICSGSRRTRAPQCP